MDKIEEIKKDIKKYSAIDAVANSDGGKIIIKNLQKDIVSSIDELSNKYKTISHIEIIALCARLSERLTTLRILTRARKNKLAAKEELERILKEE